VNSTTNDAIILCGETGSGKSTQVPQFLYEAGYGVGGMIGITQPRRVAVTSTAERVAFEMKSGEMEQESVNDNNDSNKKSSKKDKHKKAAVSKSKTSEHGQLVGYQIRFDSTTVGPATKIKFMTDGILLKEVAQDLLLRKYRVVILDEAHERNMNTDVLLGKFCSFAPAFKAIHSLVVGNVAVAIPVLVVFGAVFFIILRVFLY
jgi:ATP-dependent RNA helicase DHX37/DHR1